MIKHTYELRLASPAFLGDAEQKGVWRTPPLKALIREWWRVGMAQQVGYEAGKLKPLENRLFGTAADDGACKSEKSRIRLSLKHWSEGTLTNWEASEARVSHSEVKDQKTGEVRRVGAELYLGYGPLEFRQGTQLKNGVALQAGESNALGMAFPLEFANSLSTAFALAHWFGTVGGRSRNGWGSLEWGVQDGTPALPPLDMAALEHTGAVRALAPCLALDWPHAIGKDGKGALVWHSTQTFRDWHAAMKFLAQTKIAFRVEFGFEGGQSHREPQQRHVLAYPVTHHKVTAWEGANKGRLANTLRFKLRTEADGTVRALIYHTPCKPTLPHAGLDLLATWQRVHRQLDANPLLVRLA